MGLVVNSERIDSYYEILDKIFPIGRGFIDFTDTDYSNYLGFTWERTLMGVTPIGLDISDEDFNKIGKTGGEKRHTLTIDEMPSHSHAQYVSANNGSSAARRDWSSDGQSMLYPQGCNTGSMGNNQSHNNLQPYEVVAFWKRIK